MQNFGKIQNTFNNLLSEGLITKDKKSNDLFKKYVKTIKESKLLRTQFFVYNNIENKTGDDYASLNSYVNENLKFFEEYKISDIIKENKKLNGLLDETKILTNDYNTNLNELHEALNVVITTKKTPVNLGLITENINKIINYIKENKIKDVTEVIQLPNSLLSSIMFEKFNERYGDLNESDKQTLITLITSNDIEKKDIYEKTLRECIDLINENLKGSDLDAKDKLLQVKDKLLNYKDDTNENLEKKILKLIELKEGLI